MDFRFFSGKIRSLSTIFCLSLLLITLLAGCGAKSFEVDFDLPADSGSTVRMLYYAADKKSGRIMESVCALHQGKGKVKLPAILPAVVYILSPSGKPVMAFYAERGDRLKITSDSPDPLSWRIKGNKISEEWSGWRLENTDVLKSRDAKRINKAVAAYVKANSDSPLSTLLLLTVFDRGSDTSGFVSLLSLLKGEAAKESLFSLVARADLPEGRASVMTGGKSAGKGADKFSTFKARTVNGPDTLRPGRPTLLFFWHSGQHDRKAGINIIRRLSRESKDSTDFLLADFCLDPDSISWRQPLKGDSLSHTIRAWLPKGEADSAIINLGVNSSPSFIVADSKGRITYRGHNPAEAEIEFKKIK
ncbi:MAG: DUF4369 domain-containing protein [Bacteroidales bacterium]|nr:DUF4369 domain-containing protein [Bacteroidales bacterium]